MVGNNTSLRKEAQKRALRREAWRLSQENGLSRAECLQLIKAERVRAEAKRRRWLKECQKPPPPVLYATGMHSRIRMQLEAMPEQERRRMAVETMPGVFARYGLSTNFDSYDPDSWGRWRDRTVRALSRRRDIHRRLRRPTDEQLHEHLLIELSLLHLRHGVTGPAWVAKVLHSAVKRSQDELNYLEEQEAKQRRLQAKGYAVEVENENEKE